MNRYNGPTPKRHYAYANSRAIKRLDIGYVRVPAKHKTVKQYTDSSGRQRYVGTHHLRGTENLDSMIEH